MRKLSYIASVLGCVAGLAMSAPAQAGDLVMAAGGANVRVDIQSMRERKFATVVHQQFDFSCGSAAVATLLSYHYEMPTTETDAFEAMWAVGNQDRIRELGFSLLEMKRYIETLGLKADGFQLTMERIEEIGVPGIALISTKGYRHFVVVKGMTEKKVLLGDPSKGLLSVSRERFEEEWDGVILFVRSNVQLGKENFNNRRDWALAPTAPHDRAMEASKLCMAVSAAAIAASSASAFAETSSFSSSDMDELLLLPETPMTGSELAEARGGFQAGGYQFNIVVDIPDVNIDPILDNVQETVSGIGASVADITHAVNQMNEDLDGIGNTTSNFTNVMAGANNPASDIVAAAKNLSDSVSGIADAATQIVPNAPPANAPMTTSLAPSQTTSAAPTSSGVSTPAPTSAAPATTPVGSTPTPQSAAAPSTVSASTPAPSTPAASTPVASDPGAVAAPATTVASSAAAGASSSTPSASVPAGAAAGAMTVANNAASSTGSSQTSTPAASAPSSSGAAPSQASGNTPPSAPTGSTGTPTGGSTGSLGNSGGGAGSTTVASAASTPKAPKTQQNNAANTAPPAATKIVPSANQLSSGLKLDPQVINNQLNDVMITHNINMNITIPNFTAQSNLISASNVAANIMSTHALLSSF